MRSLLVAAAFLYSLANGSASATPPPTEVAFTLAQRMVSTQVPAAQRAFDEGLTLLYAFNPAQARASFREAVRLDPNLALAYWGVALSYGININTDYNADDQRRGASAIADAKNHQAGANEPERGLIAAAAARYAFAGKSDGDRSAKAYNDAMEALATRFPNDDDILTLTAESAMDLQPWSLWTDDGKPVAGTERLVKQLEAVLARNSQHIGANHYLIHALEASPNPGEALASARRLAADTFAPAAEHLAHMPAHIFMHVGDYHAAGLSNARAIADFQRYLAGDATSPHKNYLGHDCSFGVDAFMMSGEESSAMKLADDCDDSVLRERIEVRFRRWAPLAQARGDLAAGLAAVAAGHLDEAEKRVRALQATVKSGGSAVAPPILAARIAEARGDVDGAVEQLKKAVELQDHFGYAEPPRWWFPIRESLGGVQLRAGRYADAARTFRADLVANPNNPRSLFGLAEALRRQGDVAGAASARAAFNRAWQYADGALAVSDL